MLKPLDYDQTRQPVGYAAGRALPASSAVAWCEVFAAHAAPQRPLSVLDLGSGTGRFSGLLAQTFGGPVYGVEPSDRMRAVAEAEAPKDVSFLAGRAEAIPLPDDACDLVLMFLSFHHVRDREAAAAEVARVLRPGGRVFIRSQFADRFPDLDWHAYFPSARGIELEMFPSTAEVEAAFAAAGLRRQALVSIDERFHDSLREHTALLKHRAISTFEHMDEAEIVAGFARLDVAVAAETTPSPVITRSDLMVLAAD